jgi:hypothetical protein
MTAIILHRTDPAKHMRRFYRLDVQPDLFGAWCLIREWGRIGSAGRAKLFGQRCFIRGMGCAGQVRTIPCRLIFVMALRQQVALMLCLNCN